MSKTIRKYQSRDRQNQYRRIERLKLEDKYYTDVAKSHDRKTKKNGLPEDSVDSDSSQHSQE